MAQPLNYINVSSIQSLPPIIRIERRYTASTKQLEYMGFAPVGATTSQPVWTVQKISYNANNQNESEQWAYNIAFDDREASTYA